MGARGLRPHTGTRHSSKTAGTMGIIDHLHGKGMCDLEVGERGGCVVSTWVMMDCTWLQWLFIYRGWSGNGTWPRAGISPVAWNRAMDILKLSPVAALPGGQGTAIVIAHSHGPRSRRQCGGLLSLRERRWSHVGRSVP